LSSEGISESRCAKKAVGIRNSPTLEDSKSSKVMRTKKQDAPAEQLLLQRIRNGSPRAFADLVRMHSPQIYQISLTILKNHADAEDNLQSVFCKVCRSIDGFQGRSRLSSWLARIAVNEALMSIRRRHPEPLTIDLPNLETEDRSSPDVSDCGPDPERRYLAKELLARAFAGLSPSMVALFVRNKSDGWTQRELAREIGVRTSAVKSQIFRARQQMQKQLQAVS
jgi:RNA polymerase sigma-70 factor (ECF subfamily)